VTPKRLSSLLRDPSFWLVVAMLAVCAFLHYSPHIAILKAFSPQVSFGLTRHVMDRILFLLPITYAAFVFGWRGGLIAVAVATAFMMPRAILLSPQPLDACLETGSVVLVGGLVILFFQSQQAERRRRLKALAELEAAQEKLKQDIQVIEKNEQILATLHTVSSLVSQSLELQHVLNVATDQVMKVMDVEVALVFLLDEDAQELVLEVHRGVSEEFARGVARMRVGEGFNGRVAESGEPLIVEDASQDPRLTRAVVKKEGLQAQLIVPLKSKGKVVGTLCVAVRSPRQFLSEEAELLTAIGYDIGIAIENARLYEEMRLIADELKISEKKYRDLFENASDAIWVHDLEGNILAVNKAFERLTGYGREELSSMKASEILSERGLGAVREMERRLLSGEAVDHSFEVVLIKKGGAEAIIELQTTLVATGGQPSGFQHTGRDVTEEKRMQENLRFYVQHITKAQEEERKRIARELHDDTAQALVALSRQLEKLTLIDGRPLDEYLILVEELRQQTDAILQEVRRFSQDLRPSILDDLGLLPALEFLADDLTRSGIDTRVRVVGEARRLSPETELVLFRIVQEALRNVRRHSQASRSEVAIEFSETKTMVSIGDNGRGFELPKRVGDLATTGKLGLAGMQERARLLGGTLTLESQLGAGTKVVVEVPM